MNEYGFDYFTDRILFLEADEPDYIPIGQPRSRANIRQPGRRGRVGNRERNLALLNSEFNKIYEFIGDTIRKGGEREFGGETLDVAGKGGKRHRYRQLVFTLLAISELGHNYDDIDVDDDGGVDLDKIGGGMEEFAMRILGLNPRLDFTKQGVPDLLTLYSHAISKIVSGQGKGETPEAIQQDAARIQPYHDYIKTPTFKNKATNTQDILTYSDLSRISSQAAYDAAKEREAKYGMPHEEIDIVQTKAAPLVAKIKREQVAEKQRTIPKYPEGEKLQHFITQGGSSFQDNLNLILDALESTVDLKNKIRNELKGKRITGSTFDEFEPEGGGNPRYDATPEELEALYFDTTDTLDRLKEELESQMENGIDFEDFEADMAVEARNNPNAKEILRVFMKEMNALKDMTDQFRAIDDQKQDREYKGYNAQILAHFLKTPEDKELFDKWYRMEQIDRAANLKRLVDTLKRIEAGDAGTDSPYLERGEAAEFRRAYNEFMASRGKMKPSPKPEVNRPLPPAATKPRAIKKAALPKRPQQLKPEDEEYYESYDVMDYMTEQIIKDERTHPRGEFKDRGFKKARSYAEWLWLNNNR